MRIIAAFAIVAATATTAFAQPPDRLTDVEYMQAARCAGLASAENLGAVDTASIKALLKEQGYGRAAFITDKASEMQSDAARAARHANGYGKERLLAERDGVCKRFLG